MSFNALNFSSFKYLKHSLYLAQGFKTTEDFLAFQRIRSWLYSNLCMALRLQWSTQKFDIENTPTADLPDHYRALTLIQTMFGNEN